MEPSGPRQQTAATATTSVTSLPVGSPADADRISVSSFHSDRSDGSDNVHGQYEQTCNSSLHG